MVIVHTIPLSIQIIRLYAQIVASNDLCTKTKWTIVKLSQVLPSHDAMIDATDGSLSSKKL